MKIDFIIKGKAKAKQSVKFGRNGINLVRLSFINKYPAWSVKEFAEKPLKSVINVYMSFPKSFSKKKQAQALSGQIRPVVKPDCDNLQKI